MKTAAIYARVSSVQQREEHTIASQTAALVNSPSAPATPCPMSGSSKTRVSVARVWFVRDLSAFVILRPKARSKRC